MPFTAKVDYEFQSGGNEMLRVTNQDGRQRP